VTYESREQLASEQRILLDPAEDAVDHYFVIKDEKTGEIGANPDLEPSERERAEFVIDFFNLNGDVTARTKRARVYDAALRAVNESSWKKVKKMAMRHSEQSVAARCVLLSTAPEHLPTETEELLDLLRTLWDALKIKATQQSRMKQDEREFQSYCRALTILQEAPAAEQFVAVLYLQESSHTQEAITQAFRRIGGE
jgi:hypothetical protein